MLSLLALLPALAAAAPTPTRTTSVPTKRDQCSTVLAQASALIGKQSGPGAGGWSEHWTDANLIEDGLNYALATNDDAFAGWIDDLEYNPTAFSLIGPGTYFDGSNDDALWAFLMYTKYWDWLQTSGSGGSDDANTAKQNAIDIYNLVSDSWTDDCGGGILWDSGKTYKNTITNALYLLCSAAGYSRGFGDDSWLANADKTWAWMSQSGMRSDNGLWQDGQDEDSCTGNGQTAWTYNQGVVASGLATYYSASGSSNTTLIDEAKKTLDGTLDEANGLVSGGILKESCDATDDSFSCNTDQKLFKGLFMKHLQYFQDASGNTDYSSFMGDQSSAIFTYAIEGDGQASPVWIGANDQGADVVSNTAAAEAYLAAAKYVPC